MTYNEQSEKEKRRAVLLIGGFTSLMSLIDNMFPQTPPRVPSVEVTIEVEKKLNSISIAKAQAKRERRSQKRLK